MIDDDGFEVGSVGAVETSGRKQHQNAVVSFFCDFNAHE